jgi:uncharacterized membrane protein (UPF0127 family)
MIVFPAILILFLPLFPNPVLILNLDLPSVFAAVISTDEQAAEFVKITLIRHINKSCKEPEEQTIAAFEVETASTPESKTKGLAGREKMPENHGMLFIMSDNLENLFWMKGMKFSIDILFFDRNKNLIDIFENLSPCVNCPLIQSSKPAAYALEINAGMAEKYKLQAGDTFVIEKKQ